MGQKLITILIQASAIWLHNPTFLMKKKCLIDKFGTKIIEGRRYLGAYVSSEKRKHHFIGNKIREWLECIAELSKGTENETQAALVGLTGSLQSE